MKATKLIEILQNLIDEHGDVDVCYIGYEGDAVAIDDVNPAYPWKAGQPFVDDIEAGAAFFMLR